MAGVFVIGGAFWSVFSFPPIVFPFSQPFAKVGTRAPCPVVLSPLAVGISAYGLSVPK